MQCNKHASSEQLTTKTHFSFTLWASGFPSLYTTQRPCFHLAAFSFEILCFLLPWWQRSLKTHPGLLNSHRWKVTNVPWINVLQKHITPTSPQWMLENVGEHMGCWLALVIFSRMVNEYEQGNIRSTCQIHYDSSGLLTPCAVFPPDMWS